VPFRHKKPRLKKIIPKNYRPLEDMPARTYFFLIVNSRLTTKWASTRSFLSVDIPGYPPENGQSLKW